MASPHDLVGRLRISRAVLASGGRSLGSGRNGRSGVTNAYGVDASAVAVAGLTHGGPATSVAATAAVVAAVVAAVTVPLGFGDTGVDAVAAIDRPVA